MAPKTYKIVKTKGTLIGLLEEAYADCESVNEELTNWRDGLQGTNLENSEKYSRIEEAVESIESVIDYRVELEAEDGSKVSEILETTIEATYYRPRGKKGSISRAVRLENAAGYIRSVISALEEISDVDDENNVVQGWIDTLNEHADTLEGIEVPGMFG